MTEIKYELTMSAQAEVIPGPLSRIRRLCEENMTRDVDGRMTDADKIWPSDILAILDSE